MKPGGASGGRDTGASESLAATTSGKGAACPSDAQAAPSVGLAAYVENTIIPLYDGFDRAHGRDHVRTVIERSLALATHYDVDIDMVYAIAAFHDLGLAVERERHHIISGEILQSDPFVNRRFTPEQIATMREAVEDHRASAKGAPRTIYGRIVAEADRLIDCETILRRTVQYSLANYPVLDCEGHFERCVSHLRTKYGQGGYLRLWIEESDNVQRLARMREMIGDTARLRALFERLYAEQGGI